ncbi:MAG: (2Fe-2S)-binding protein, partial [Chloroflexi bacterium]
MRVNGAWREADVWPGTSLLAFLREALGLYGSKNA